MKLNSFAQLKKKVNLINRLTFHEAAYFYILTE